MSLYRTYRVFYGNFSGNIFLVGTSYCENGLRRSSACVFRKSDLTSMFAFSEFLDKEEAAMHRKRKWEKPRCCRKPQGFEATSGPLAISPAIPPLSHL